MRDGKRHHCKTLEFGEARDCISKLHNEIICCILSSLTLKDLVKTSVLSARWRDIWTYAPVLKFDEELMIRNTRAFIRLVNQVLQQHQGFGVHTFKVHFPLHKKYSRHLDKWINFAIVCGTRDLDLNFYKFDGAIYAPELFYEFPFQLFSGGKGSCLERLHLRCCTLGPCLNFNGFNHLNTLGLCEVSVTDNSVHSILLSCPVLESFTLSYCRLLVNLLVAHTSPKLQHLSISKCKNLEKVTFFAVNIVNFEYEGHMISFVSEDAYFHRASFSLKTDTSSAVNYVLNGFIHDFTQLQALVLYLDKPIMNKCLPQTVSAFSCLKHLKLVFGISSVSDFSWIPYLLSAAPFVVKLEIQMLKLKGYKKSVGTIQRLAECQHDCLETAEITGCIGDVSEIELALYLIDNAVALKTLILDQRYPWRHKRRSRARHAWVYNFKDKAHFWNKIAGRLNRQVPSSMKLVIR